ncbi:hypothetical protein ACFWGI_23510 [Streptomyces niveus]|uniref:hypothetical protein n=1 Tax=Streptomyces niveus TaxID=193462 RepID=UPI00364888DD
MQWQARQEFERRAGRQQGWGVGLMVVAVALFLWLGYLLLIPFTVHHYQDEIECEAPVFYSSERTSYSEGEAGRCSAARDWPELVGVGVLAVPPAVVGAALFTGGSARRRASAHVFQILEMRDSEERARKKTTRPNH